jgi:flagellar L-ring protein precursor FlgH
MKLGILWIGVALAAMPVMSSAQTADPAAAPAADTVAAAVTPPTPRAAWFSDRMPLRVGDLITVVVDEQAAAREQVSQVATGQRSQRADLAAALNGDDAVLPSTVTSGVDGRSRDVGEARRLGDLTGTMTVRVTSIDTYGIARIEGERSVTVDGREQKMTLRGSIRAEDVTSRNTVASSRVADAVIDYKGKKMSPRTGFIGKLIGMLWP